MPVERGAAYQGQTVRLRILFQAAGTPVDPFEVRQVEILDSSLAVLATIPAASIVQSGVGQYYVDWAIPAAEAADLHHDRWYSTLTVGATEKQFTLSFLVLTSSGVATGGAYITVAEARSFLPSDTPLTDAEIAEGIALAQEIIEEITGQTFTPIVKTVVFDGQGEPTLSIRRPIQTITSIRLRCDATTWETIDIDDARISGSGTMIAFGNVVPKPFRRANNRCPSICASSACRLFPRGFQNVEVSGTWGAFDEPPRQIRSALGLLLRYALVCEDSSGVPSAAFSSEAVANDRSYTLRQIWSGLSARSGAGIVKNAMTGYPDVDAILARFIGPPTVAVV